MAIFLSGRSTENTVPNRIPALLVTAFSIILFGTALGSTGLYREVPHRVRVGAPLVLALEPLFLMYTTAFRTFVVGEERVERSRE